MSTRASGFYTNMYINTIDISMGHMLALAGEKTIKIYHYDTFKPYWYDLRYTVNNKKSFRNENIKAIKWNQSELNHQLLAVLFDCPGFYILHTNDQDREAIYYNMTAQYGTMKELIWFPNSKDTFITASSDNFIYMWDLTQMEEPPQPYDENGDAREVREREIVRIPIRKFNN